MGNAIGGSRRRRAKIMKINGETTKMKTPIQAKEVTENHPAGHVLLDSEAVKHYGIRAKPLEPTQYLEPKRVYFLVELPKQAAEEDPAASRSQLQAPRRVRSGGIHVSAKDRLESLMLSRRSVSDLSAMKPMSAAESTPVRLRMRLPKADVERLVRQSKDEAEAAQRIMDLCCNTNINVQPGKTATPSKGKEVAVFGLSESDHEPRRDRSPFPPPLPPLRPRDGYNHYKKRVGFLPVTDDEIRLAVAS